MKLYYSITSPFARKVRVAADLLGLESQIELISTDVYAKNDYYRVNPLVKIPALQLRDGNTLTNSPFILEYLDSISLDKKSSILKTSNKMSRDARKSKTPNSKTPEIPKVNLAYRS